MNRLRITPLNIVTALLLTWLLWRAMAGGISLLHIGGIFLLLLVMVIADQFFRAVLRSVQRVWIGEGVFVALVALVLWVLKGW